MRMGTATIAIVCVIGLVGGLYYWNAIAGLFKTTDVSLDAAAGGALNVLMVGSDSRAELSGRGDDRRQFGRDKGGKRADTIILAQVVPSEKRGVLLSIPRDLWVTVHHDGLQRRGKINSAYQYGPQAMIDTVRELTGVPINHYMEVTFNGFRRMVDAIGGIDICNEQTFSDSRIDFTLEEGYHHLNGNDALQYVRTRRATADGDFGRIKRQQQFFRAVIKRVGRPSVLANPVRVNRLATAFAQNVTVDQYFKLEDMMGFALQVRRVGPDQLATYSVPGRSASVAGQSAVLMYEDRAEPIFRALREVRDPAPDAPSPSPAGQAAGESFSGIGTLALAGRPCPPGTGTTKT